MTVELTEPVGWVTLELNDPTDRDKLLRTHLLQLKVLSMHQNGRDTHIRQLKVFGPRTVPLVMGNLPLSTFKTECMIQYSQLR